jgi:DNA-binding IclR family transcriptional regulator
MTTIETRADRYDRPMASIRPLPERPSWTFLTNHSHVLVAISRDPELRQRDIADLVGITQGAVTRILHELEASGCVTSERVGRRNRYHVNPEATLRHPLESGVTIGELLELTNSAHPAR